MMPGVWLDERIGGRPCQRLCDPADLMRVPDELRDCTCFIQAFWSGEVESGSAFFVGVDAGYEGRIFIYAVTARHLVLNASGALADEVHLVVNSISGIQFIKTDPARWLLHPTADVAVLNVSFDSTIHKIRVYPLESIATKAFREERAIGPGDDVFITGLLVHHPGKTRIMPIVRLGCIAGLPEDPVKLETGEDVVGLLEVRSIGGLSGSPVFLHLPFWRDIPKAGLSLQTTTEVKGGSGGQVWLFGVMHGFYPVGQNDPDRVSRGNEDLNTGIAVVVLADRILDLINGPDQVRRREMMKKRAEESQMPKPAAAAHNEPSEKEASEYERFEDLARKLVTVPKQELDEKRQQEDS